MPKRACEAVMQCEPLCPGTGATMLFALTGLEHFAEAARVDALGMPEHGP